MAGIAVNVKENTLYVKETSQALFMGTGSLANFPGLLRKVLELGAWREFLHPNGETITHERFADFVEAKSPRGLGSTVEQVKSLVADDNDLTVLLREALVGKPHVKNGDSDNITITDGRGTSKSYTLDRLTREAPELREKVDAGELSASAAAVLAGFQPKRFTVVATTPQSIAKTLRKQLPNDVLAALIEELRGTDQ